MNPNDSKLLLRPCPFQVKIEIRDRLILFDRKIFVISILKEKQIDTWSHFTNFSLHDEILKYLVDISSKVDRMKFPKNHT